MFKIQNFQAARKGLFGENLHYFDKIDSTNRAAADLARWNVAAGTVVIADSQSEGRGRNSHSWYSPPGVNLYFTVILYPSAARLHYLPFLIGLGIADALEPLGIECDLKWPNDVMCNGKKISGVLIQTAIEENRLQFALAGIGINVNVQSFPAELEPVATSVVQQIGHDTDREDLLVSVLWQLELLYGKLMEMTWEELTDAYQRKSSFFQGCDVFIEQQGKIVSGRTAGVDRLGGLIVETTGGSEVFYAGEIQACRKR
jgi:BirA family transcriptional regulator, biotin operon repressor / biotin---[acetyl-CoA-carboxylase] ligase